MRGQFGIGKLKKKVQRSQLIKLLSLALRENAARIKEFPKRANSSDRQTTIGLIAEDSKKTTSSVRKRIRIEVRKSGGYADALISCGGHRSALGAR